MHLVTHTCGAQLWRHQTGGVQQIVIYGRMIYGRMKDQCEIHECPRCGENLRDADLRDERGTPIIPAPSS